MFIHNTAKLAPAMTNILETLEIFVHRMLTDHVRFHSQSHGYRLVFCRMLTSNEIIINGLHLSLHPLFFSSFLKLTFIRMFLVIRRIKLQKEQKSMAGGRGRRHQFIRVYKHRYFLHIQKM